jgi:hypothetical protein
MEFLSFAQSGSFQLKRDASRITERLISEHSEDLEACSKEQDLVADEFEGKERRLQSCLLGEGLVTMRERVFIIT